MTPPPLLDTLLQRLLATDDPIEKAAIVAESAFAQLPVPLARVAQRCVILRWFDEIIVTALLDTLPGPERVPAIHAAMTTLSAFPFVEPLAWGWAYHDQTRTGLLARTPPVILQQAAALAVSAYETHPNPALAKIEALYCALVAGQHARAAEICDTLLTDAGRREDWQALLTVFHAVEEASRLPFVAPLPRTALHYALRGLARHHLSDLVGAIADYTQAIALDPADATIYYNRGIAHRDQGDLAGAVADYTQAIALNPAEAMAYDKRPVAHSDQGDLAGAIEDYDSYLRLGGGGRYEDQEAVEQRLQGLRAQMTTALQPEIDQQQLHDEAYREQVFTLLLRDYERRILRYCVTRLGDTYGEEVAQEVFLTAWENLPKYRQEAALETWLTSIAKYHCIQALRKRRRRQLIADSFVEEIRQSAHTEHAELPEHALVERDKLDQLAQCLRHISSEERIILTMRYAKELPIPEIAELLGKPEAVLRKQLIRALQRLRRLFHDLPAKWLGKL